MGKIRQFCGIALAAVVLAVSSIAPLASAEGASKTLEVKELRSSNSISVGGLEFTELRFSDFSASSVGAFGVSGYVENESNETKFYSVVSTYYDASNSVVFSANSTNIATPGISTVPLMYDAVKINAGYDASDIVRYTLEFNLADSAKKDGNELLHDNAKYSASPYVIDSYDIFIEVNENNTFDVTEKLDVYYREPRHGIKRNLPTRNKIVYPSNSKLKDRTVRARISNIEVEGAPYTAKSNLGEMEVKIGDANKTITGSASYVIKYTYDWGKDGLEDIDEFYWNIIGTDWDAPIGDIDFSIRMPKGFEANKIGFTHGIGGSIFSDGVIYSVKDNTINGSYAGVLSANNALTIRVELPEGYFTSTGVDYGPGVYLTYLIPAVILLIVVIMWMIYGRDERYVETVEMYPPEDINSAEAALILNGCVCNSDIMTLLYYLAGQGYILIEEGEKKKLTRIIKLREYDGVDDIERSFMKGLFSKPEIDDEGREYTTPNRLEYKFYTTLNAISKKMNGKKFTSRYFAKNKFQSGLASVLGYLAFMAGILIPYYLVDGSTAGLIIAGGILLFYSIFIIAFSAFDRFAVRMVCYVFIILHMSIFLSTLGILSADFSTPFFAIGTLSGLMVFFIANSLARAMPRRTELGNEYYSKLRSLRKFMTSANNEQLEMLRESDPGYFFATIAFAVSFGIARRWLKRIRDIGIANPDWYRGYDDRLLSPSELYSSISSISNTSSSSPSSSSGSGGSGGGGSSGGGGGGGGGSSW